MGALNVGNWTSIFLVAVACYALCNWMLPETMKMEFFGEGIKEVSSMSVFYENTLILIKMINVIYN